MARIGRATELWALHNGGRSDRQPERRQNRKTGAWPGEGRKSVTSLIE